jgi:hypothetical protein
MLERCASKNQAGCLQIRFFLVADKLPSHNIIIIIAAALNLCVVLTLNWLIIRRGRKQRLWN